MRPHREFAQRAAGGIAQRFHRLERRDPSAHGALVRGARFDVLVDAGYGTAVDETERLLQAHGARPGLLALTHMHGDHAGGAGALQARLDLPVALHETEAALVNGGSAEAGDARWLDHPLAPFGVDRPLADGEVIDEHGGEPLVVVHLGAQTPGHVAFHLPESGVLLSGDLLQERDVAWLPPGAAALSDGLRALDRMEATGARTAIPGHGPPVPDVSAAIDRARQRYERWLDAPAQACSHAVKRLVVATLQIDPRAIPRLAHIPSLRDYAAVVDEEPEALVASVVEALRQSGVLADGPDGCVPQVPHDTPGAHPYGPLWPPDWPEDRVAQPGPWPWPSARALR